MVTRIRKRDGRIEPFSRKKIIDAITPAMKRAGQDEPDTVERIAEEIENSPGDILDVEQIQNMVELKLMKTSLKPTAKEYIIYRNDRSRIRNNKTELMRRVREKLLANNVENQNANVDEKSFGGRIGAVSSEVMKQYALDECMSEMARNNHLNNEIYIHDLDHYAIGDHNCLSIPFDNLLANGFNTRQTDVRPANSVNTAFQLVAVIFQLQSLQQFGGVSATHLDWTMVPYVRKSFYKHYVDGMKYIADDCTPKDNAPYPNPETPIDNRDTYWSPRAWQYAMDMTEKEIHQAVEGMYHNLNTLQSRSGCQLPFTSINYGTCTLPEGRMVTTALLNVSIDGIGKLHRTPIFPCGIFQCQKGVNQKPGDPNYDLFRLALKSTARRLYPNYANVDWSGNAGYDPNDKRTMFSTMGKRNTTAHVKPFELRPEVSTYCGLTVRTL